MVTVTWCVTLDLGVNLLLKKNWNLIWTIQEKQLKAAVVFVGAGSVCMSMFAVWLVSLALVSVNTIAGYTLIMLPLYVIISGTLPLFTFRLLSSIWPLTFCLTPMCSHPVLCTQGIFVPLCKYYFNPYAKIFKLWLFFSVPVINLLVTWFKSKAAYQ